MASISAIRTGCASARIALGSVSCRISGAEPAASSEDMFETLDSKHFFRQLAPHRRPGPCHDRAMRITEVIWTELFRGTAHARYR